jgi:hypothetical protein
MPAAPQIGFVFLVPPARKLASKRIHGQLGSFFKIPPTKLLPKMASFPQSIPATSP